MKTFFYLFVLLSFASCTNQDAGSKAPPMPKSGPIVIEGTISNSQQAALVLISEAQNQQSPIQQGSFRFNLTIDQPEVFALQYGRAQTFVYVKPGDHLTLSLDGSQFPRNIQFSGDSQFENTYLSQKYEQDRQEQGVKPKDYKLEEAAFIKVAAERRVRKLADLEKFTKNQPLDPLFVHLVQTDIQYEWGIDRIIYPRYHAFYTQKEDFKASAGYDSFMKELDLNAAGNLSSQLYRGFLSNYVDLKGDQLRQSNPKAFLKYGALAQAKFDLIEQEFTNAAIRDYLLYKTLKGHIKAEGANGTTALYEHFNQNINNTIFKTDIQKDYSRWIALEAGKEAPKFAYPDIEGQVYGLDQYKGKYVYVDVWATWCGPCKREIPHLEELQEQYKENDNIVFTSVSIDQNTQAWEKMVTEQEMKGVQLLADQAWQSSIVKDYKISGIPRFLLIDPAGKIVSAHASRPSSEQLKMELAELVEAD